MLIMNKLKPVIISGLMSLTLVACGGSSEDNSTPEVLTHADYRSMMTELLSEEVPGVVLLVESPEDRFLESYGNADTNIYRPLVTDDVMPVGVAGQKLIGLLAVMLAEDGLLDLDARVESFLEPSIQVHRGYSIEDIFEINPDIRLMTVRQLLNHTSGLKGIEEYDRLTRFSGALLSWDVSKTEYENHSFLAYDYFTPSGCDPGECWQFTDGGYGLVGLILTQVLGEHPAAEVRSRILEPLGMNASYYAGVEKDYGEIISGYFNSKREGRIIDFKSIYEDLSLTSTPLHTSVEDLALLLKAIVTDSGSIDPDIREVMVGEDNMLPIGNNKHYSMGIFKEVINGTTLYYSNGFEPGYTSVNIYIPESDTSISAFFNGNSDIDNTSEHDELINKILLNVL